MKIHLHQTHHQVADFESIFNYLTDYFASNSDQNSGLHIFSELYLTGYPLQDLCLQKAFVDRYLQHLEKINNWSLSLDKSKFNFDILLGGLDYVTTEKGLPKEIRNVVFHLKAGEKLKAVYTKQLLPSYDIFDESKYFKAGEANTVLEIQDHKIGILICEDMWSSNVYDIDPCKKLNQYCQDSKIQLDMIVNLSASPFNLGKNKKRIERASELSSLFGCPFAYVNRVGGEDEILFDGGSFILEGQTLLAMGKSFEADQIIIDPDQTGIQKITLSQKTSDDINTWEDLFNANLVTTKDGDKNLLKVKEFDDQTCKQLLDALIFGFQEYASRCGFNKFLVALSGGMDSALVLAIIKLGLKPGQSVEAIYMPSEFSSNLSWELSYKMCNELKIALKTFSIKFIHSVMKNAYKDAYSVELDGLANENVQSRLRGTILYTHSNKSGAMVINTSNKSELAVGYSTQYGDSVGAISLLGDLYKSEVFKLANYINKDKEIIPQGIIDRPPSAELRDGQVDTDSLPPYEILDAILEGALSYQYSKQDLIDAGFSKAVVDHVLGLYTKSEYKRAQFCPIIKVKSKSFGFGYRIPTSKSRKFYF